MTARLALHTRLRADAVEDYERLHATIPDDLDAALRNAGVQAWQIWRDGVDLFHVVECDDPQRMWQALNDDAANASWQAQIAPLLDVDMSYESGDSSLPMVWQLPER